LAAQISESKRPPTNMMEIALRDDLFKKVTHNRKTGERVRVVNYIYGGIKHSFLQYSRCLLLPIQ